MSKVTFWSNTNLSGSDEWYSGERGKSSGLMGGITSLETDANTWLVVFDSDNYEGNYFWMGPSQQINDLEEKQRGSKSKDDWKNQISSFAMYSEQPSTYNSTPNVNSYSMNGCTVRFFSSTNYAGDYWVFGNCYDDDFGCGDEIESIKVGTGAWLSIYDEQNLTGNTLSLWPNMNKSDLNDVTRGSNDDWKHQVNSFYVYNQAPSSWNVSFNKDSFYKLYPNNTPSGSNIEYQTQDCEYRINLPVTSYPDANSMDVALTIDHIISMSTDDHVELDLKFNADGSFNSLTYSWTTGEAYQIPKQVIEVVDATVELAAAVGAVESLGISEAAAAEFIEDFDTICKVFNKISNIMNKWSENDGGRFYLIPVVCHTINRVCASVSTNS